MTAIATEEIPYWQPEFERLKAEVERYQGPSFLYVEVTIPATLSPEPVEHSRWPVQLRLVELPAQHREMIDFLVEQVTTWPTA